MLAGCWDERLIKNFSIITLSGMEGEMGDLKGYYSFQEVTPTEMKTVFVKAKGISPLDVRYDANLRVEQTMDLSMLSTVLISDKTASDDIYQYLDVYFRGPINPITSKLALVEGDMQKFFDITKDWKIDAGEYYASFIKNMENNSLVIPYTLQTGGSVLFEHGKDLSLPYLKVDEKESRPVENGVALFSGKSFTGKSLSPKQGIFLTILNDKIGKSLRLTYLFEDSPVTILLQKANRKVKINGQQITMQHKLNVNVIEFPDDNLKSVKKRNDVKKFLEGELKKDMNEVITILQDAKSDAIGIGKLVRAYHPKDFVENWSEHFATLDIKVDVKVKITTGGILY